MLTLPEAIISILAPFAMLFQSRTWTNAQVLLVGAVLSPDVILVFREIILIWGISIYPNPFNGR